MTIARKLRHEIAAILLATIFFAVWFVGLLTIKWLILLEYDPGPLTFTKALVGALVVAKVVVLLERVRFGTIPAWVDVMARTLTYGAGVVVVLLLERGIEGRHEAGSVREAILRELTQGGASHVVANIIVVVSALLAYNAIFVLRQHLGEHGLRRVFFSPLPCNHRPPAKDLKP